MGGLEGESLMTQGTGVLAPTEELIAEVQAGRMVILVDDEDRENEGDLV
ncbi:DHBP synthase RibB domain protein, partial [mine drainage metagenome]